MKNVKNVVYTRQIYVQGLGEIPLFDMLTDHTPVKKDICPYSTSCFDCPMADCVLGDYKASTVNEIPIHLRGARA